MVAFWREWRVCVPIAISILAAVFTGLQWREAHQQRGFQLKPLVNFYTEDGEDQSTVGVSITNNGPGPAIIKSITYFVDRKLVRDVDEAVQYGKLNQDIVRVIQYDEDDALASGRTEWLISRSTKAAAKSKMDREELDRFLDFIDEKLGIEITYCSIDDECGKKCSTKGRC